MWGALTRSEVVAALKAAANHVNLRASQSAKARALAEWGNRDVEPPASLWKRYKVVHVDFSSECVDCAVTSM